MNRDIKRIVSHYRKKFNTNDPFVIADQLGILYQTGALKYEGCYMFLKNHRYIFLNEDLPPHEKKLVMAHEFYISRRYNLSWANFKCQHISKDPVWITSKSTKYHMDQHCCGIKNPIELELSEAKNKVYILVKNVAAKIFNFFT